MKKIVKEISQKKNLEQNLPIFADYMGDLYYRFAKICLCMNYYTYFEMILDGEAQKNSELEQLQQRVNEIITYVIQNDKINQDTLNIVDEIRQEIIEKMKVLTAYADVFDRYEYILNRIEYKFKDIEADNSYSDEEFTRKIMNYIVEDEDAVVVNSKIAEVMGELPMRMTKSKFYERVNEGLNVYKTTDVKSLNDFIYMVSSSAMLYFPEKFDEHFSDLNVIYNDLKNTNYKEIDSEQYDVLHNKLNYAATFIQDTVNVYMMLQQIVNEIYVIVLSDNYSKSDAHENEVCNNLISYVYEGFNQGEIQAADDKIEACFIELEGKQESIHEEYMRFEYIIDQLKGNEYDLSEKLKNHVVILLKDEILLSDSLFVEFNDDTLNGENGELTDEIFEEKKKTFIENTEQFFENHERAVNRSVMSAIISSLPVFFNNIEELQDYIYNSLNSCRDNAEKTAVVEILNSII